MQPTIEKAMSRDAGPPAAKALPEATKRPVPNRNGERGQHKVDILGKVVEADAHL